MPSSPSAARCRRLFLAVSAAALLGHSAVFAAPVAAVHDLARQEQQSLLDTLRDLVAIESGSKDVEGLEKIAALIADRLRQLGGKVDILPPADVFRMDDTPAKIGAMVQGTWKGTGTKNVLLIAHMDTVYLRGMLKDQPFRIEGNKAYGLGIADDKQGVALILHIVAMLNKLGFKGYGTLTVLINGDEEISSPGSRSTITRVAGAQDAVLSFEGGGSDGGLRLATSGIGRPTSRSKAGRRMPAPVRKAASTRSTSSRTKSCRRKTCRRTTRASSSTGPSRRPAPTATSFRRRPRHRPTRALCACPTSTSCRPRCRSASSASCCPRARCR